MLQSVKTKLSHIPLWTRNLLPVLWIAVSLLVWIKASNSVQHVLVYLAAIYALRYATRAAVPWKNIAGIAFAVLLIHEIIRIPFSTNIVVSGKALFDMIRI